MVFSLRVNPQPSNFINEPNLRTFKLALVDDDVVNSVPVTTTPTITAPPGLTIQKSAGRSTSVTAASILVFLTYRSEATKLLACRSKTTELLAGQSETIKLPMLMNRMPLTISALVEYTPTSRGSLPRN